MTGDCHVRFSERPEAKLPRATHLVPHAGICAGGDPSPTAKGRPYRDRRTFSVSHTGSGLLAQRMMRWTRWRSGLRARR